MVNPLKGKSQKDLELKAKAIGIGDKIEIQNSMVWTVVYVTNVGMDRLYITNVVYCNKYFMFTICLRQTTPVFVFDMILCLCIVFIFIISL